MGWDEIYKKHNEIAESLYAYTPEEREDKLKSFYGMSKNEFPEVDFGDSEDED